MQAEQLINKARSYHFCSNHGNTHYEIANRKKSCKHFIVNFRRVQEWSNLVLLS